MIMALLRRLRLVNTATFVDPAVGSLYRRPGGGNDYYYRPGSTDVYKRP